MGIAGKMSATPGEAKQTVEMLIKAGVLPASFERDYRKAMAAANGVSEQQQRIKTSTYCWGGLWISCE